MSEHDPERKAMLTALGLPLSRAIAEARQGYVTSALDHARLTGIEQALRSREQIGGVAASIARFGQEYRAAIAPLLQVEAELSASVRAMAEPIAALQEQWRTTLAPLAQLRWAGLTSTELRAIREPFHELQRIQVSVLATARLDHLAGLSIPKASALTDLARAAAAAVVPLAAQQEQFTQLGRSLADQMRAVQVPWAFEEAPDLSAIAFARVSSHAQALLQAEPFTARRHGAGLALFGTPFAEPEVELPTDAPDSRDDARVDSGADTALFVIPREARLQVGRAVGLLIPPPDIPIIRPIGVSEEYTFSTEADAWLRAMEVRLRFFVVGLLRTTHGETWLRTLPPGLVETWEHSRRLQLAAGRPEYELFHYAQLGDWLQIINRHWKLVFSAVFKKKAYLETAFDHLIPLRNEDGHHRPMATTDQLIVVVFSRMLLDRIEAFCSAEGMHGLDG